MVELITKITNLSYDQYLALTEAKDYGSIQVNIEHIPDTPIGAIKEIFVDKDDISNVYAKLEINDGVYNKIKDKISGCSVELVYIETDEGVSIPTACSMLLGSEPAVDDAGKKILERVYSKIKNAINDIIPIKIKDVADKEQKINKNQYAELEQIDNIANIDELRKENQKLIDELEKQSNESANNILALYFSWIMENINNFDEQKLKDFVYSIDDQNLPKDRTEIYVIMMSYSLQFIDEYNRAVELGMEPDLDKIKENIAGNRLKSRIFYMLYKINSYKIIKDSVNEKVIYLTMNDDRVRPEHRKLQGTVFIPKEHPELIPPIDYNCRCFTVKMKDIIFKNDNNKGEKVDSLKTKYNKGKELYISLKKDYAELEKAHNELEKDYIELEKAHRELKEKVIFSSDEENKGKSNVKMSIIDILTK